jgi:hypothetical protein
MSKIGERIGSMRHKMSDVIASKFDLALLSLNTFGFSKFSTVAMVTE